MTISNEFLINQFTSYNQRTPAVAALTNGGFVVAWVSEQERARHRTRGSNSTCWHAAGTLRAPSVDIYARLYTSNGVAAAGEFLVNTDSNPCAIRPWRRRRTAVSWWPGRSMTRSSLTNGWDIFARPFSSAGVGGTVLRVNTHLYGDQYAPRISAIGWIIMLTGRAWGRMARAKAFTASFCITTARLVGGEFRVNTTTISQQMQPAVASDGASQFLVVWTSYTGPAEQF